MERSGVGNAGGYWCSTTAVVGFVAVHWIACARTKGEQKVIVSSSNEHKLKCSRQGFPTIYNLKHVTPTMSSTTINNPVRTAPAHRRTRCGASPARLIVATSTKQVTLLDYGAGNVCSVRNAIKKLGYTIKDVRP